MEPFKKPLLSVIVPIFNGEGYLDGLIAGIAAQQFPDMELILVDDGSSDGTLQKCKTLQEQHTWIKVVHTDNRGVSHARNTGLKLAQGQWIHFVDADDRIREGMYYRFLENAEVDHSDVIICGCRRVNMESGEDTDCGPETTKYLNEEEVLELFDQMDMNRRYWLLDYIWNKWYRKELIDKYHLFFEESLSLGEDFVFNAGYFQHVTGISMISDVYYMYLIRKSGLVSSFHENPWEIRETLYDAQRELYQALGLFSSNEKNLQRQAGRIAFGDIRTINSPRCRYKRKQKIKFVQQMIESPQYVWILQYLNAGSEDSLKFKLYYQIFLTGHAALIASAIQMEKLLCRISGKK